MAPFWHQCLTNASWPETGGHLSRRERAADTRRKILVGAIVLAKVEQGELDGKLLRQWLKRALMRKDDRELFDLRSSGAGRP